MTWKKDSEHLPKTSSTHKLQKNPQIKTLNGENTKVSLENYKNGEKESAIVAFIGTKMKLYVKTYNQHGPQISLQ